MRRLAAIRLAHTVIWAAVEASVGYLVVAGVRLYRVGARPGRGPAVAGTVVGLEVAVFTAAGFRCPLTAVAERAGAASGSVTDLYLPRWLARSLPALHVPVLLLLGYLYLYRPRRGPGRQPVARWRRASASHSPAQVPDLPRSVAGRQRTLPGRVS